MTLRLITCHARSPATALAVTCHALGGAGADGATSAAPHLLVEWEGGALPDMLADAVIAVLLQVRLTTAGAARCFAH